jgi:WD40 repeat protein
VGQDGLVIEWRYESRPENKEWECRKWSQNSGKYTSGVYERSSKSFLASGQEMGKSVVREFRLDKEQMQKIYNMGFRLLKLQWLNSQWNIPAIIAGTDDGAIKVFNSPYDNIVEQTLNVHLKEVTGIQVSPCGRYVFSVGEDNNIFVFQVSLTNREGFISKRLHEQVNEYELNPLVGVLDD